MSLLVVFIILFQLLFLVESNPKFSGETTWLFTFGDSTVDLGYNAQIYCSSLNANYYPFGIDSDGSSGSFDCHFYCITGRQTFQNLAHRCCGPAGILPNNAYSWLIELFNITVQKNLPKLVQNSAQHYLTNSGYDYLSSSVYAISFEYNPQQFAALLVNKLGSQIKTLYELGARSFMVFEVGPIGCYPFKMKKYNSGTKCVDEVNNMIRIYNQRLDNKIRKLMRTYNTNFVIVRVYNLDVSEPCCGIRQDGMGRCLSNEISCLNRKRNLFWDGLHLAAVANKIIINKCFHGSSVCAPTIRNFVPSGSRQPRTRHFLVNLLLVVMISIISSLYI
ncbi:hypothetical protein UlMin_038389 [Ulmus minor]